MYIDDSHGGSPSGLIALTAPISPDLVFGRGPDTSLPDLVFGRCVPEADLLPEDDVTLVGVFFVGESGTIFFRATGGFEGVGVESAVVSPKGLML